MKSAMSLVLVWCGAAVAQQEGRKPTFEVAAVRMTATSAARDATNRDEFFDGVRARFGVEPRWWGGGFDTGGLLSPVMSAAIAGKVENAKTTRNSFISAPCDRMGLNNRTLSCTPRPAS